MTAMMKILTYLYDRFLRLYPRHFRLDFEQEMSHVYQEALAEAGRAGMAPLLSFIFRELYDWPKALLRERLFDFKAWSSSAIGNVDPKGWDSSGWLHLWRTIMSGLDQDRKRIVQGRRPTLIAVLPPLLLGLGFGINAVMRGDPWYVVPTWQLVLSIALALIPMSLVAVGGIYALVKRMPDWSLTWVATGYMGLVLFIKTLAEEAADEGKCLISPSAETVIAILLLLAGIALLSAAALRSWQRGGLFSIALAGTMALSLSMAVAAAPFNRTDLSLLAMPLGILLAALMYFYMRGTNAVRIGILCGVGLINVSMLLMTNSVWQGFLLQPGRPSPFIPLLVLLTLLLVSGPILGLILRLIRKVLGKA